MSHETPVLDATMRERTGTRYAQRLRKSGRLPAVIYGHEITPTAVSIDEKAVLTHLHHGAHLFTVRMGGNEETCLVKDLQFGYLGDNVIHIDFTRVNLNEEVTVNVHLNFYGSPEAAKKPGAILQYEITDLEVRCKVRDIPDEIRVDISEMEESYIASEITLPEGVELVGESDAMVVNISYVREEEAEGEEVDVAGGAEPEVISDAGGGDEEA